MIKSCGQSNTDGEDESINKAPDECHCDPDPLKSNNVFIAYENFVMMMLPQLKES